MIGFLGLSHLGLVSALAAAAKGHDVVGFDEDAALVARIAGGDPAVVEPGLAELLATAPLRLTDDPAGLGACDLLYVGVDVPTAADDRSDTTRVDRLLATAARVAPAGSCIVVLSQVEPGFTRARREVVERDGRSLCYQVETLVFGRAVERALEPERFVVGCGDPTLPLPAPLRRHLESYGCRILPMRYESAELAKIAINAFLVSSISTTNMLAELCEAIGADWSEIAPALRLDRRIGEHAYLGAGLGIGGSNLSRDLATIDRLARETGSDASLVGTWRSHAAHRHEWPLRILATHVLGHAEAPRVGVWGLAYKDDTHSTRNSPGLAVCRTLACAGVEVLAYDPHAEPVSVASPTFRRVSTAAAAAEGADALVLATPWREFREVAPADVARMLRGRTVVDPYGLLDGPACAASGLEHHRLGSAGPC